jgi:hypothetical protein
MPCAKYSYAELKFRITWVNIAKIFAVIEKSIIFAVRNKTLITF